MIQLSLPYPPTVNSIWRNFKGRSIKSAKYRAWSIEAQRAIADLRINSRITGPYHMEIQVTRPDRRRRDLSNLIKVPEDAIVQAGLVRDDCDAESVKISWAKGEPKKGGAIHVWLWGAE